MDKKEFIVGKSKMLNVRMPHILVMAIEELRKNPDSPFYGMSVSEVLKSSVTVVANSIFKAMEANKEKKDETK